MSKKIKNLKVKTGTYEKDGRIKGRYVQVGVIMTDSRGDEFILLDKTFNPAGVETNGSSRVLISVFDADDNYQKPMDHNKETGDNYEDDKIPF